MIPKLQLLDEQGQSVHMPVGLTLPTAVLPRLQALLRLKPTRGGNWCPLQSKMNRVRQQRRVVKLARLEMRRVI